MVNSALTQSGAIKRPIMEVNESFRRRRVIGPGLAAVLAAAIASLATGHAAAQDTVAPATVRNVTPPGVLPGPDVEGPLVREPVVLPDADPPEWHRFHLPATHDAATFEANGLVIRLAGVTPPDLDANCAPADGDRWPCGRVARHALRMFLRGRAIECYFPFSMALVTVEAPCRVGATDLALWLVAGGWATADEEAPDDYRDAAAQARCTGAGMWRGRADAAACN